MNFSERLDVLLKGKSLTAKQLTKELNIGATAISDWKRGKSTPSPSTLVDIAKYFKVSTDWLLTGNDSSTLSKSDETEQNVKENARKEEAPSKPSLEDAIRSSPDLSEEGKKIMLSNLEMVRKLESAKEMNEISEEFKPALT